MTCFRICTCAAWGTASGLLVGYPCLPLACTPLRAQYAHTTSMHYQLHDAIHLDWELVAQQQLRNPDVDVLRPLSHQLLRSILTE
eukprot:CAMPEP_0178462958 /NCGR_PEP_ID=MMETSP0689_2-20121128/50086_1 /TAXON_ID=160604 /ORGANISM="Amphidinium massartii, Strain CS-259" /LENGTH=84 /DNA_ID=CAMNT_0020089827 /DNA_START=507 /DNA_END=761 /DNA_ORIENTATION=-